MVIRRHLAILVLAILAVVMPSSASASITPTPETRIGNFELREPVVAGMIASRGFENHRAKSILRADLASQHSLRWKGMWRFDLGGGTELYDARARVWSPALGTFLSVDEFRFQDSKSTLWGWPNQNPIRWSDPSGRDRANSSVGLFTQAQITAQYDASGQFALDASRSFDAGNYGDAAIALNASLLSFEGAALSSLFLQKRAPTGVDAAMMACPIEVGGPGSLPANAHRTVNAAEAFARLQEYNGISPELASERLHAIKQASGLGGADNVVFDFSGGVYHPDTLEQLGSLTEGGAKR